MANGIFYHKADSQYDDLPDQYYHFPSQYLRRVESCIGDRIIYYGPVSGKKGRYYTAVARVVGVRGDATKQHHFYADVDSYIDFDEPVNYLMGGGWEKKLVQPDGSINAGRAVHAVRIITEEEFSAIVSAGLSTRDEWPDRDDVLKSAESGPGFAESSESSFEDTSAVFERPIIQQLLNRPFREAKFRQHIRIAYNRTCAFTGLRLINGSGRPEVEAAHIRPVEAGGSDSVRNGIALSATMHWMFDRGLLSIADDHEILQSRHLNYDVSHILNKDMKVIVPSSPHQQPHPDYLRWHRERRFKI